MVKNPKHRAPTWRGLCDELRDEDGTDPRRAKCGRTGSGRAAAHDPRRLGRLCGQVQRTLRLVLSACHDEDLQMLEVYAVEPAPDAGRLQVTVGPALPGQEVDPRVILAKLEAAAGYLRGEVAAAIVRKRAPQLVFRFHIPPAAGKGAEDGEVSP